MRSLAFVGSLGIAFCARIRDDLVKQELHDDYHDGYIDVEEMLREHGHDEETVARVSHFVADKWEGSDDIDMANRRMKAFQLLALEQRWAFWNASGHAKPSALTEVAHQGEQPHCAGIGDPRNAACRADVEWAYHTGRHQPNAGEAYHELAEYAGVSLGAGTMDDFHKLFHCGMGSKCPVPPCGCTHPPCDQCGADDAVVSFELGFEEQCAEHPACVGMQGDCCPNTQGVMEDCCHVVPDVEPVGPPVFTARPHVPGQEIQTALHGGRFLGPLRGTRCRTPREPAAQRHGQSLTQCANLCSKGELCKAFSFLNGHCKLYADCRTAASNDATMLFVKNTDGLTPHNVPTRTVDGSSANFQIVGDWGSGSCPGHASMHYVHRGFQPGSERWEVDHHAQRNVARRMGEVGATKNPFMVVNAGDNFYWGGVFHESLGGRDIHDATSFRRTFEEVYDHPSLMVPWMTIMGNHDYGGDGCFANVRAQFDYTIRDLLHNDRWKMPSPFYTHRVNFDDFSMELFMIDTNVEDSNSGRHGGICAQEICHETMGRETAPRQECVRWFRNMWNEERVWLRKVLEESTADWKIIVGHHKPHGEIAHLVEPLAREFGVQLLVGSHTHEMAMFASWHGGPPLLVVGAGGGAQGAPGCNGAIYCSGPTGYGFSEVDIDKNQMEIRIHSHDGTTPLHHYVCVDGRQQSTPC